LSHDLLDFCYVWGLALRESNTRTIVHAEGWRESGDGTVKFRTFGDFPIALDNYGNIPDDLDVFWSKVDEAKPELRSAKGCYIFGIRTSGGPAVRPWYIGKTVNSFESECFQPHKRALYGKALNFYERATPCLFLVSRLTERGAFYAGTSAISINFLERHLISLGLQANDDLLNKRDTKLYREVQLPGILNEGYPDAPAKELRRALRLEN
jgi:hypothetical protein